jgi:peptidoglycan/xylan/chitin deacetylase (PgdA/CDA1 family)
VCRASCELLAQHQVPATFFVPAVSALLYPDEQRRVIAEGHEIGLHGWIHELNSCCPRRRTRPAPARV